jgi:hypothetical protein
MYRLFSKLRKPLFFILLVVSCRHKYFPLFYELTCETCLETSFCLRLKHFLPS